MDRILIVLREGLGLNFEAMRPALQVGAAVAIGRGGAVIDRVVEGDAFEAVCPTASPYPGSAAARRPVNPCEQPSPAPTSACCGICSQPDHVDENCPWQGARAGLALVQKIDQHIVDRAAASEALKPSIFDVITGAANLPPHAAQELPSREEHAAQIERVAADLREHGPDRVILKPCAHCGGPPVPFVQLASQGFGAAPRMDSYGEDGLSVEAFVYCHECGATGPMFAEDIFDASDYEQALAEGVRLWQDRDGRHADLYEANAELNVFPRPVMEVAHD